MIWLYNFMVSIFGSFFMTIGLLIAVGTGVAGFHLGIGFWSLWLGIGGVLWFFTSFLSTICLTVNNIQEQLK